MSTGSLHVNRDIILAAKRQQLRARQQHIPLDAAAALALMQAAPRHLLDSPDDSGDVVVIGQIMRGDIYDPVTTAMSYVRDGAYGIALFTDHGIYEHDLDDALMIARALPKTPVLYQNYILSEYGVLCARGADASAVMLYASLLDSEMLRKTTSLAQRYGMAVFIQVNNRSELERAAALSPHVLCFGDSLSSNIERALMEMDKLSEGIPFASKRMLARGLTNLNEVGLAISAGVDAIFAADALLRPEMAATLQNHINPNPNKYAKP